MKKILILILIGINLFAWEVNTHRAIDREALKKVDNLNAFTSSVELFKNYANEEFEDYGLTYFKYITDGEGNGMSDLGQKFTKYNYQDLLEAGSILEDAQWPHWEWPNYIPDPIIHTAYQTFDQGHGRFLNHFYNYQGVLCKSYHCIATDAVEWAYDDGNDYDKKKPYKSGNNYYDYKDAMSYFEKGFSESDNKMKEA